VNKYSSTYLVSAREVRVHISNAVRQGQVSALICSPGKPVNITHQRQLTYCCLLTSEGHLPCWLTGGYSEGGCLPGGGGGGGLRGGGGAGQLVPATHLPVQHFWPSRQQAFPPQQRLEAQWPAVLLHKRDERM